jgi:enoyl-CoA hydratase/carnithine racemase
MAKKYPLPFISFDEYANRFERIKLSRDEQGILTVRLHKNEGEFSWNLIAHREVSMLWNYIGMDPENKVIILTGTGEAFLRKADFGDTMNDLEPEGWFQIVQDGKKILTDLLEVEQPIIVALNGPVSIHSQIPMLGDILICTPETTISDTHFSHNLPGDGHHVIWPLMFGLNRAKYLFLMQDTVSADEAKQCGLVSEIVASEQLMDRANEIARKIVMMNPLAVRQFRPMVMQHVKRAVLDDLTMGMMAEGYCILRKLPGQNLDVDKELGK